MQYMKVSELVSLDLNWVRGEDQRFRALLKELRKGAEIQKAIQLIRCGCGKTYVLQDGGHRISAAFRIYQETGNDLSLPVNLFHSSVP